MAGEFITGHMENKDRKKAGVKSPIEMEALKQQAEFDKYINAAEKEKVITQGLYAKNNHDLRKYDHEMELNERKQLMAEDAATAALKEKQTNNQINASRFDHETYMDMISNERELAKLEMQDDENQENRRMAKRPAGPAGRAAQTVQPA